MIVCVRTKLIFLMLFCTAWRCFEVVVLLEYFLKMTAYSVIFPYSRARLAAELLIV